ncbi:MAG: GrpB family protein [Clostridia bacterium]|nr:GrpB family protein [Clostridia bacterium]
MRTAKVVVVPYDAGWQRDFAAIREELARALGSLALRIEHVGSTAVEGLSAKPCIDIDVVIQDYGVFDAVVAKLAEIGYQHEGDLGIRDREAFCYANKPHLQKHHLYVCPLQSAELHRHLTFRDFLRTHPEAVRQYGAVKEAAARLFPHDIDGYIRHKTPCIEALYAQCGLK